MNRLERVCVGGKSVAGGIQPAILLIGPTGSGKSPLGDYLEKNGLQGQRCFHFDFGANLRRVAACGRRPAFLSPAGFRTVRRVLQTGALLEEKDFFIAAGILVDFLKRRRIGHNDIVVLNGLPRHEGQAIALSVVVDIRLIVCLRCTPQGVLARISRNSGGDRAGRADDSLELVKKKLGIFKARTLPLLDHYRRKGVTVVAVRVGVGTGPAEIVARLCVS